MFVSFMYNIFRSLIFLIKLLIINCYFRSIINLVDKSLLVNGIGVLPSLSTDPCCGIFDTFAPGIHPNKDPGFQSSTGIYDQGKASLEGGHQEDHQAPSAQAHLGASGQIPGIIRHRPDLQASSKGQWHAHL